MSIRLPSQVVLTPTEKRMVALLSDGIVHGKVEMIRLLDDPDYGSFDAVKERVAKLRKILLDYGYDITFVTKSDGYRAVQFLNNDE